MIPGPQEIQKAVKTPRISVICPVWNPGPGIDRFLAAVCGQTFYEIEILFVDDLGTDAAMRKIEEAAKQDPRIRILTNRVNIGPGWSRNAGIEEARGEYLSFMDPDDYPAPDFLELLYAQAKKQNLDVVKGTIVYERADGSIVDKRYRLNDGIRRGLAKQQPLYRLFTYEHQSAIYRRKLLTDHHLRYGQMRNGEDVSFLLRVCHTTDSFAIEENARYYFCAREGSAARLFTALSLQNRLDALQDQIGYLIRQDGDTPAARMYAYNRFHYYLLVHGAAMYRTDDTDAPDRFLAGLRNLAVTVPFLEGMKKEHNEWKALVDDRVNLTTSPYKDGWGEIRPEDWLQVLSRWAGYLAENPGLGRTYKAGLYRVLAGVAEAEQTMRARGCTQQEISSFREKVKQEKKRLPGKLQAVLKSEALFSAAGYMLMKARQTRQTIYTKDGDKI